MRHQQGDVLDYTAAYAEATCTARLKGGCEYQGYRQCGVLIGHAAFEMTSAEPRLLPTGNLVSLYLPHQASN